MSPGSFFGMFYHAIDMRFSPVFGQVRARLFALNCLNCVHGHKIKKICPLTPAPEIPTKRAQSPRAMRPAPIFTARCAPETTC